MFANRNLLLLTGTLEIILFLTLNIVFIRFLRLVEKTF